MPVPFILPAGLLGGIMAAKAGRNFLTRNDENGTLKSKEIRDNGVVNRLLAGSSPPVSFWSEQMLERQLKTNSAMQMRAHELREARKGCKQAI
jgi:hypothetical protein